MPEPCLQLVYVYFGITFVAGLIIGGGVGYAIAAHKKER